MGLANVVTERLVCGGIWQVGPFDSPVVSPYGMWSGLETRGLNAKGQVRGRTRNVADYLGIVMMLVAQ